MIEADVKRYNKGGKATNSKKRQSESKESFHSSAVGVI